MELSARYDEALTYAAEIHRTQSRKGSGIPYLTHLMAVSGLVLESGGSEDEAIAGLLHDALEDQPDKTSYEDIEARFGAEVARIVRACSDTEEDPKPPWRERKEAYLRHLATTDDAVLRVSRSDKLHNARAIVTDLRDIGPALWGRFNAGCDGQLWYYARLAAIFTERAPGPHADELAETAKRMAEFD